MHPLRLNSPFSAPADSAHPLESREAGHRRGRRAGGIIGQVSKGLAAFVVGIVIGASTILLAEAITPAHGEPGAIEAGPLQLRR
jgi:hypothetical protein